MSGGLFVCVLNAPVRQYRRPTLRTTQAHRHFKEANYASFPGTAFDPDPVLRACALGVTSQVAVVGGAVSVGIASSPLVTTTQTVGPGQIPAATFGDAPNALGRATQAITSAPVL